MFIDPVVYAIINTADDKHYIGQTYNKSKRFKEHVKTLNSQAHCNTYLQRAWLKCGQSSFIFVVLEKLLDTKSLTEREQYWIDLLEPEYNLAPVAGSQLGYKHTEEARANMRNAQLGKKHSLETRAKMSASRMGNKCNSRKVHTKEETEKRRLSNLGKKRSPETLARMSAAQTGRVMSEATKIKMSISAKKRWGTT